MEIFQCMGCGATKAFHASPPVNELYALSRSAFEVVVVWDHSPTLKDLAALRREIENLQDTSLMDLKAKVTKNTFSLGWHLPESAQKLAKRLQSAGLDVEMRK
jgi:hypothetical protein